jgi:hypothetical protein
MRAGIIHDIRDENGKPGEVEVVDEDLRLSGHIDGVYTLEDGSIGVMDFKTSNSLGFWAYSCRLEKAKKAHIEQVNLYAGLLGAKEIKVVYVNKNGMPDKSNVKDFEDRGINPLFFEYTQPFDEALFKQSKRKLKRMAEFVDNFAEKGELPPKIYDNQCSYCGFKWMCKTGKRETKKKDETVIAQKPRENPFG